MELKYYNFFILLHTMLYRQLTAILYIAKVNALLKTILI